ncbi:MAG: molecular chaperone HtpG [Candidatus Sericytochromatia bacterium]|nr:molecular chaperone HtpG [Candidatus Sericytochromatia bacterium]
MSETITNNPTEEKGTISVNMENIFPIIKKFLYSDKEIFLRELISNSIDAINKYKHLALIGEVPKDENESEYVVEVTLNKDENTMTITDNGIGLTAEEVKRYINQVAFSGAEEFLKKYKSGNENDQIIGHFGLGFYSSFMVAKKVVINSLSCQENAEAIRWECDGTPEFQLGKGTKNKRGTEITLYLADDEKEFSEETRVKHLIKKYCDFLPYKITVDGVQANKQKALWNEQPLSLKKEDYLDFYDYLYPFSTEPLFWIHINVDYPFNLKGILYFPQLTHELDMSKGHIKLYSNNVYVSENTHELLPRFLTVLQGGVDSPDIPLNVSRSMLQNEPHVRKISSHISKKVADRLKDMFNKEREEYEKVWEGIQAFVKVGMMEDDKFYDQVKEAIIFKTSDNKYKTLEEYLKDNKEKAEGKVFYTSDTEAHANYLSLFKEQGIDVIILDTFIDSHFINFLEMKNTEIKFSRIDSDISDTMIDKDAKSDIIVDPETNKTGNEALEEVFKSSLNMPNLQVKIENLKSNEIPGMIVFSEQMRRMHEMTGMMQQKDPGFMKDYTLIINANNPIIDNLKKLSKEKDKSIEVELICNHVHELALLSQKQLPNDKMSKFLERSNKILELLTKSN